MQSTSQFTKNVAWYYLALTPSIVYLLQYFLHIKRSKNYDETWTAQKNNNGYPQWRVVGKNFGEAEIGYIRYHRPNSVSKRQ